MRIRTMVAGWTVLAALGAGSVALAASGPVTASPSITFGVLAPGSQAGKAPGSVAQPTFGNAVPPDAFQTAQPYSSRVETGFGPIEASGYRLTSTLPALSDTGLGQVRRRFQLRDVALRAAVGPGITLNAGYNFDRTSHFSISDALGSSVYDGLFTPGMAVTSPYLALTDGGNFVGATIQLSQSLQLNFGTASLDRQHGTLELPMSEMLRAGPHSYFRQRTARSAEAGVTWDFAKWGGVGLTASSTTEHGGLLGRANSSALSGPSSANTTAVGVSAHFGFGKGWVTTFSYNEGITQLNLRPDSMIASSDHLRSRAYSVAVAKHGLFSNSDALGLALSRPLEAYNGSVTPAMRVDRRGNLVVGHGPPSLLGNTPETDVELGYVTTFFDGALALQANAGYQMNVAGQKGTNALTVLSRAKINF